MATRQDPSLTHGDSRSAREIRRDIERERRSLDSVLVALEHRLSPVELGDRLWTVLKNRLGNGGLEIAALARRHPLPLALIGAGVGWMIVELTSGRRREGEPLVGPAAGRRAAGGLRFDPNPLALGAVALGAGVVAGLVLPSDGDPPREPATDWSGRPVVPPAATTVTDVDEALERLARDPGREPAGPIDDSRVRH